MMQSTSTDYLFKILVVGEASTGKTSFIKRYVHQFFSRAYRATIGVDFALKTLQYDEKTVVRLQLWDVAGQERFGSMTRVYYKDAVGAFLVFDASRLKTFESVLKWKTDLDSKVSLNDGSNIPCLLLANKCDLIQRSEEDERLLQEFAEQNGFIGVLYTSPKDNVNIEQAARILVKEILKRQQNFEGESMKLTDTVKMTEFYNRQTRTNQSNNNHSSCC